ARSTRRVTPWARRGGSRPPFPLRSRKRWWRGERRRSLLGSPLCLSLGLRLPLRRGVGGGGGGAGVGGWGGCGGAGGGGGGGGSDLSRTVGWFTSLYPVRLDVGGVDVEEALAGGAGLGRALKLIKEQLRAVPGNGLGYGLLRYLNARTGLQLSGFAAPQIGF